MAKSLVIVESPAKAKKIGGILGSDYVVESSVGHIRDLPANAAEVPAEHKGKPWASMGVDTENDFEPVYVINPDKKKTVSTLRKLMKGADELVLATDKDREGEAIAWHLLEILKPKVPVKRMVFGEITKQAIEEAIANTIDLDDRLVDGVGGCQRALVVGRHHGVEDVVVGVNGRQRVEHGFAGRDRPPGDGGCQLGHGQVGRAHGRAA